MSGEGGALQGFELSPQQRHLWRLRGVDDGCDYRAEAVVRLSGSLETEVLRTALAQVVARHEILRTRFECLPGMSLPLQVVGEEGLVWVGERQGAASGQGGCEEIFAEQRRAAEDEDDAGQGPLHALLWRTADEGDSFLCLSLPALCADRETLRLLVGEIATALGGGFDAPDPEDEPLQFADLAAWLNELLEDEETEADRRAWSREEFVPLLGDHGPWEVQSGEGFEPEEVPLTLERDLLEGRATDPTGFLLACWQLLLWRHLEGPEFVVSVLCAGREFEELEGALGPLAGYLPLRVRPRGGEAFSKLARRASRDLQQAEAVSGSFSWDLLEGEDGESPAAVPAPTLAFDVEQVEARTETAIGVQLTLEQTCVCSDSFFLKLVGTLRPDGLEASLHFDAARCSRSTAEILARRFEALVGRVAAAEDRLLGGIDVLTAGEREQLLVERNRTALDHGAERRLHGLVWAQAARTPERIALFDGSETLTYAELEGRAAALARRLLALGAQRGEKIALFAERSADMVVGLLGILSAGAAYVPLAPDHPRERLAAILTDVAPRRLVAQERLMTLLPSFDGTLVPLADPAPGAEPATLPQVSVEEDDLAYVIHTSGSTGRPKGVMVSHLAITNRLLWMQKEFPLGSTDRVLQKTPYSFDASIWEIFCPLLAGAELVLARPGAHADSASLVQEVVASEITVLQLVPSLLHPFLEEPGVEECTSLKRMFCGGELLPRALAERFSQRFEASLCNLYGPTETAIDATAWLCGPGTTGRGMPIGRPLSNVQVFVLSPHLLLTPPEVPGELFVGGEGLARGYQGRPGETAARFLPNPWSDEAGQRLYRTGDLVRRLSGGELEYLGRIDRQVKIRGARIELREIEAVLVAHAQVSQAVVVALPEAEEGEGARLAAYLVPQGSAQEGVLDLAQVRGHAGERLPSYMLPGSLTVLHALPRLPNGKIDIKALPEPVSEAGAGESVLPRTPTEQILAGAWGEVLAMDGPGVHDNFFDLGGHSLRATQLITRLRQLFEVDLGVRDLFQRPTIAELATHVDTVRRQADGLRLPPMVPVPRDQPLVLSFAQRRLWFLYRMQPDSPFYNISVALEFQGELDVPVFQGTLAAVVRRHESLRTTYHEGADGEPEQRIGPAQVPPLPVVDLSGLPAEVAVVEADRQLAAEVERPFNIGSGPVFRALLFKRGEQDHLGILNQHHIATDGWSTSVLVGEVVQLYGALAAGERAQLPELEIQYADFASWQRQWLQGELLDVQVDYWREQLRGAPPVLELKDSRPRPAVRTFEGANLARQLTGPGTDELNAFAQGQGVTLFMLLIAAGQAVFRRASGQEGVVIGTDVANRNRSETEGLIGFFINQLALYTDLSGDPGFTEVLERVREVALGAYAHEDLPFDKLVEVLNPTRSRSHSPIFQVKINLLNVPTPDLELPGVDVKVRNVVRDTAQFDLIFNFVPAPEALGVSVDYSTELFDAQFVERLLIQFETLLTLVVQRPEIPLSELDAELERTVRESERAEHEAQKAARGEGLRGRSRRRRSAVRTTPGGGHAAS